MLSRKDDQRIRGSPVGLQRLLPSRTISAGDEFCSLMGSEEMKDLGCTLQHTGVFLGAQTARVYLHVTPHESKGCLGFVPKFDILTAGGAPPRSACSGPRQHLSVPNEGGGCWEQVGHEKCEHWATSQCRRTRSCSRGPLRGGRGPGRSLAECEKRLRTGQERHSGEAAMKIHHDNQYLTIDNDDAE